jgi:hypothetical protein
MALTKVTYEMMDTPLPYSVIEGAPISVLDYADLAVVTACRDPGDPNSHLLTSFLNWTPAIQAALDACFDNGGGSVVLPKNTVPYYVQDQIIVKSNTTLICEDWLVLADYNLTGATLGIDGDNVLIQNLLIDNSGIYAGGSGYNGVGASGEGIKIFGGYIKNCARGNVSPADGGKGVQIEDGDSFDITVSGVTFENCFMAMSTFRDYTTVLPYNGIVYSDIVAFNCDILFFVRQANGAQDPTGLEHTVQLNNFYAKNCGAFEGVMQFSRASNVLVSNGIIVNDPLVSTTAMIRGNHANCQFVNIGFYGDTNSVINLDPGTYSPDSSQAVANNRYDVQVWGQVDYFVDAAIGTPYRTLDNCFGSFQSRLAPATAWFGYELRNGTSVFELIQGQKAYRAVTNINFDTNAYWPENFADVTSSQALLAAHATNVNYDKFKTIAAASVPNNSVFLDTATGKLSFKDNSGVVNALY